MSDEIEKCQNLDYQVKLATNTENSLSEMQINFQNICSANNELKSTIEELNQEVKKRDKVFKEWNETLETVELKIAGLEQENESEILFHTHFNKI